MALIIGVHRQRLQALGLATIAKRTGSLLLLFSILFPMSSCQPVDWNTIGKRIAVEKPGNESTPSAAAQSAQLAREYHYVITKDTAGDPKNYLGLAAFVWPLFAAWITARPRSRPIRSLLLVGEFLLIFLTGYMIYLIGWLFSDPEAGAHIASTGLGCYAVGWFATSFAEGRSWWKGRHSAAPC